MSDVVYQYRHPVTLERAVVRLDGDYLWIAYSTGEAARWEVAEGRTTEEAYLYLILEF